MLPGIDLRSFKRYTLSCHVNMCMWVPMYVSWYLCHVPGMYECIDLLTPNSNSYVCSVLFQLHIRGIVRFIRTAAAAAAAAATTTHRPTVGRPQRCQRPPVFHAIVGGCPMYLMRYHSWFFTGWFSLDFFLIQLIRFFGKTNHMVAPIVPQHIQSLQCTNHILRFKSSLFTHVHDG